MKNIDLTIPDGQCVLLCGRSGCGKSTLGRTLIRLLEPTSGKITLFDQDITHLSKKEMLPFRRDVQIVFQDPYTSLNPRQRVGDMLMEVLAIHHIGDKNERMARALDIMAQVGLRPEHFYRYPHEFSGGQRQRIGIARALSSNPSLIICDEPISALDVSIQAQIINLLEQIQAEMGISYIFIAHDLAVVKHISDRILVMYLGRVMEIAPCEELYEHSLHPYTQALLSAIPVADPEIEENREVTTVQGEVPSILKRPSGCPFHNRCPQCTERCKQETPQLHEAFPGHFVACHLYGQE